MPGAVGPDGSRHQLCRLVVIIAAIVTLLGGTKCAIKAYNSSQ